MHRRAESPDIPDRKKSKMFELPELDPLLDSLVMENSLVRDTNRKMNSRIQAKIKENFYSRKSLNYSTFDDHQTPLKKISNLTVNPSYTIHEGNESNVAGPQIQTLKILNKKVPMEKSNTQIQPK